MNIMKEYDDGGYFFITKTVLNYCYKSEWTELTDNVVRERRWI